jgi:hypothetical protein
MSAPLWPGKMKRDDVSATHKGDAEVFKLYSQAKLGMMREALTKLDRRANEREISSTQEGADGFYAHF